MPFPEAVLFDWDNTLISDNQEVFQIANLVLRDFGCAALPFSEFMKYYTLSNRQFFSLFLPKEQVESAEQAYCEYSGQFPSHPFPGAVPLLSWLHSMGVPMAVVSNAEGFLLRKDVQDRGWNDFFYGVVGANDTLEDKPSPTPLLYALSKKSIQPGPRIWFVGDGMVDMLCAHSAGCAPIAIGEESRTYDQAFLKVQNLEELLAILQVNAPRIQL